MTAFSQWIITLTAVALIGVLIDIILPEGQMQKYCRSIFALVILLVIVSPIPTLLNQDISFEINGQGNTPSLDTEYLGEVYRQQLLVLEASLEEELARQGLENVDIIIMVDEYKKDMKIVAVIADTKKLVLSEQNKNINYYDKISSIVAEFLSIHKSMVSVV